MGRSVRQNLRALAGGSIAAAAVVGGGVSLLSAFSSSDFGAALVSALLFVAINAGACFLVASTIGLGWYVLVKPLGWTNVHAYWIPAALLGAMIPLILLLPGSASASLIAPLTAYGAALGGFTGFFVWRIRRPDRDAPANPHTSAS